MDLPEDIPQTSGCILVLSGLPGSGKTSLCEEIYQHFERRFQPSGNAAFVVPIRYDRILTAELEQRFLERGKLSAKREKNPTGTSENFSEWKSYRNDIVKCVDQLLDVLVNFGALEKPESVDEETWTNFQCGVAIGKVVDAAEERKPQHVVMVIDDNMYYSSMRYQYFQMARKHNLGFCQAYLSSEVEESARRNALREESVPFQVITDMAGKFEAPNPSKNKWEKHSLVLSSTETEHAEQLGGVLELIGRAVRDPVEPVAEMNGTEREESRVKCSQSLLHQIDQILRKIVTQEIQHTKRKLARDQLSHFSSRLSIVKTDLYTDLKSGSVMLPERLTENVADASKDVNSPLFCFLKEQLQWRLGGKRMDERT